MKINKPRLLIPVTIQFDIRYILRTGLLKKITEYAQPVVLLGWIDEELKLEFEDLGAEVFPMPQSFSSKKYEILRQQIDFIHKRHVQSPSCGIDNRRGDLDRTFSQKLHRNARNLWYETKFTFNGAIQRLFSLESESLWNDTNFKSVVEIIRQLKIDAVFCLTPYIRNEEFVLRAAEYLKIPMCTSILSFDNLTTRGWIPVIFDQYFLWNKYNENELRRIYPKANDRPVTIVGAPQFDFYWDKNYLWDEINWRKCLGIPVERPVILLAGSPPLITRMEPYWVNQIDIAIEKKLIPNKPIILVRPHPLDSLERWSQGLNGTKNVFFDLPWKTGKFPGFTNIKGKDIEKLTSSLFYSVVQINTSSTMTLDGAIFDRPQIGPGYDDRPGGKYDRVSRELYQREHFIPITNSGGLDIAYSFNEMIDAIRSALLTPEEKKVGRKKMVMEVCTFDDGGATERVNTALNSFFQKL